MFATAPTDYAGITGLVVAVFSGLGGLYGIFSRDSDTQAEIVALKTQNAEQAVEIKRLQRQQTVTTGDQQHMKDRQDDMQDEQSLMRRDQGNMRNEIRSNSGEIPTFDHEKRPPRSWRMTGPAWPPDPGLDDTN